MDSGTPTTPTATNLFHLPYEMRHAVWEAKAPSGRDAIMECSGSSHGDNHANIDHGKVLAILHHPDVLAARQTCHEAYTAWTKATIRTLFMPLRHRSLKSLLMLTFGVDSIVTLWPDPYALVKLYEVLLSRYQLGYKPVKTVYIGISTVVCNPEVSLIANSELGECKYRLFDLEDAFLPSFLGNCHAPRKKHHSDACYIASLQEYWDNHKRPQELRKAWARLRTSHYVPVNPELKPVMIGIQSPMQIRPQAAINFRLHVKEAKLAYSGESTGPLTKHFPSRTLNMRARALREWRWWRCQACWPTEQE
jgi:hypothetical protein